MLPVRTSIVFVLAVLALAACGPAPPQAAAISSPPNRWTSRNLRGWSNAEYDRLWETFASALDPAERIRLIVQITKLASEELPAWGLYDDPHILAHLSILRGADNGSASADTWNIHQWQWR